MSAAHRAGSVGAFVAACLLLAGAASYNGYPLVHFDTGTYLSSSFTFAVPLRRPVAYSLLLAALHAGTTLWTIVAAQAAVIVALIRRLLAPAPHPDVALLGVTAGLALLTSTPWFAGQIMPDALAGATVLACFLLLRRPARSPWIVLAEGALVVIGAAVHHSHLPIVLGLVLLAQMAKLAFPRLELALKPAWTAVLVAVVTIPSLNFALTGELYFTKAAHSFLLGRIVSNGLVDELLAERCDSADYALCPYRETLHPQGQSFLWDRQSSFHRTGGWRSPSGPVWKLILDSIWYDPGGHLRAIAGNTARQLTRFDSQELRAYGPGEYVSGIIRARFPAEAEAFARARQQTGDLWLAPIPWTHRWVVWLSAALSAALLMAGLRGTRVPALDLHVFVWTALVSNAAIMSNLSAVSPRYQSRVVWLLPLAVLTTAALWRSSPARPSSGESRTLLPDG